MSGVSRRESATALKARLAKQLEDDASTAAPVTITGAGGVQTSQESRLLTPDSSNPAVASLVRSAPGFDQAGSKSTHDVQAASLVESRSLESGVMTFSPASATPNGGSARPIAARYEKLSILLEPSDLALLEQFYAIARAAGIRMRKGGNPSLFMRAALRSLNELNQADPEAWAERVAAAVRKDEGQP